jgi:lipopolysaccharide export system protein LptA
MTQLTPERLVLGALVGVAMALANAAMAQEGAVRLDAAKAIEILADTLEVVQDQQLAIFSGNVTATQGQISLNADRIVVHYAAGGGDGVQAISTIDAEGNVFFTTDFETAQGDAGLYDVENGIITLTGDVVLTRGDNVLRGTRLVLNLLDGTSRVDGGASEDGGRVRGVFLPNNPAN